MTEIEKLTIKDASDLLHGGNLTAKELAEHFIKEIEKKDKIVHSYLEVNDDVLEQAKQADRILSKNEGSSLTGIPIALKDNILIKGRKASAGSKILEGFISPYNSLVGNVLEREKIVILGRTNMDEFAMGSSTENSAFGVTKNPFDSERVAGGSSGGSAAAVASGLALAALGSDTGGSIRQPASFCGVVGLKPTYGAVSRFGLIAMASSFDQIGPITKTVTDAEIIFNAIKGTDPLDSTSFYPEKTKKTKKEKLKVGIPRSLIEVEGLDPSVAANFKDSVSKLKEKSYEVIDIELPNAKYALAVYYIIVPAEVSSNLARFDGVRYGKKWEGEDLLGDYMKTRREGFGDETRRRIMLGTYVLSAGYYDAYYGKAVAARVAIKSDFDRAFEKVDVIITPTTPTPAFKIGEKVNDPLAMYLADIFTVPANIVGIPAITIPSGFVQKEDKKLPLGLQLIADSYKEDILFEIGKSFLDE